MDNIYSFPWIEAACSERRFNSSESAPHWRGLISYFFIPLILIKNWLDYLGAFEIRNASQQMTQLEHGTDSNFEDHGKMMLNKSFPLK